MAPLINSMLPKPNLFLNQSAYQITSINMGSIVVKFHKLPLVTDGHGNKRPPEGFNLLIERAAMLIVASSTHNGDDELAWRLHKRANDCMIEAAHSPFFGGSKAVITYEGLDLVRDLVFERVRDGLIARGYPMPKR